MSGFQSGDKVLFNIGSNEQTGTIQDKITQPVDMGTYVAHASENDPQYIVKHDGTGTEFNRKEDNVHSASGFGSGEHVNFQIGNNEQSGTIEKKITHDTNMGNFVAHASKDDPQYLIKHDVTGNLINRRPDGIEEQ